jgi:pilus assembly protein Flp/PilA
MGREADELLTFAKRFFCEEEGQGMAEYGLILALVAIAAVVALTAMGDTLKEKFNEIVTELSGTPGE